MASKLYNNISHLLMHIEHLRCSYKDLITIVGLFSLVVQLLLVISGSVEINPGPQLTAPNNFSFCSWNIDSLLARDGAKISTIEALEAVHNFDVFGICESYLTNEVKPEDLLINGFSPPLFAQIARRLLALAEGSAYIIKNIYQYVTVLTWLILMRP